MQLRGISVRNVRSFEEAELDFAPGTTLVVGDVGAGKSSLLYAIEMALFGVAEVDASYLVRHGRSDAQVSVRFEDASHRYEVTRRLRRVRRGGRETYVPDTISLSTDGRTTAYSATELRQRVIELVGFPDNPNPKAHSDLWRWAVYVPQERMREILAANPEERLQTVRKALGVEKFRTAAENAASLVADLRADARRLREEAGRLAHWDDELAGAVRDSELARVQRLEGDRALDVRVHELARGRERLADAERRLATRDADRRELDSLARDAEADRRAAEDAEVRRTNLRHELERTRSARAGALALAGREAEIRADLGRREEAWNALGRAIGASESTLRELASSAAEARASDRARRDARERAGRARKELDAARAALDAAMSDGPSHEPPAPTPSTLAQIDERLVEARAHESAVLASVAAARGELRTLDELLAQGVCPTCHQAVRAADFASHHGEALAAAERAHGELAHATELRQGLEEERKSRERYERAHDRWVEAERRRDTLRQSVATWDGESRAATESEDGLARAASPSGEVDARVRAAEQEVARQRADHDRLGRELRAVRSAVEDAARAAEQVKGLDATLAGLGTESERLESDARTRNERVAARERRRGELAGLLAEVPALTADLESARRAATAAEEAVRSGRELLARLDARLEALAERIALAERGRQERAARLAEASDVEAKASWVSEPLRIHLLSMEKEILAHAQASFDRSFSRYFAALIDDPGMIARTDAAFTPEVTIDGEVTPAEALSGGERTSLALAFRLALASTVRSLGEVRLETLLLDEPTDGFSAEQVVRMGELLEELALPQVIVVSHEAQLTGIADRTVRVVKQDGRSVIDTGGSVPARGPKLDADGDAHP